VLQRSTRLGGGGAPIQKEKRVGRGRMKRLNCTERVKKALKAKRAKVTIGKTKTNRSGKVEREHMEWAQEECPKSAKSMC